MKCLRNAGVNLQHCFIGHMEGKGLLTMEGEKERGTLIKQHVTSYLIGAARHKEPAVCNS